MNKICEQAALYFYGELDARQQAAFKEHLPGCAACQKELVFLEQTQAALLPPAAPAGLVEKVLRQAQPLPWWKRMYKPVLAAVLMCALGLGVFLGGHVDKPLDSDMDWLSYVSAEDDTEYNDFVADFEVFEAE